MLFKAEHFTLCAGIGKGTAALNAFDSALQAAGVGNYNLIRVSSILPPHADETFQIHVAHGSLLPIAYGSIVSEEAGKTIAAAVGVGIPKDRDNVGVIMEFSGFCEKQYAINQIEKMVREAMENRRVEIAEIKCAADSCLVEGMFECAFAGIALW